MKKIIRIFALLSIVLVFAFSNLKAQEIVIGVRPHREIERRPLRPTPGHVWVNEEYVIENGKYVRHPGYWVVPPRPRAVWIAGHWVERRRGYVWVAGHWR